MIWRTIAFALFISPVLLGCNTAGDMPLVFVQTTTLGVSASATGGQVTPELSVGYRDIDVAVVPVTKDGRAIRSINPDGPGKPFSDSLSVLGQFNVNANATNAPNVTLGKFFATGTAASKLAEGYRCQVAGNNLPSNCTASKPAQ